MSTLIVYLPSTPVSLSASYAYLSVNNESFDEVLASATVQLLPPIQRGGELVVVIPSAALSWHGVDLPDGITATSARLRSILEGLLEDRLLDDLDTLHLALAPVFHTAEKSRTWVAACNKAWLYSHLQALEAAQRPASRIVPEFSPDMTALQLHAVSDASSSYWVAMGAQVGGLMQLPFSATALKVFRGSEELVFEQVFAEPALLVEAEGFTKSPVKLWTRSQRLFEAARSPWDLAQLDLAKNARRRSLKKVSALFKDLATAPHWRLARWGFGLLVATNLAGLNISAWQQNDSLVASRAAIKQTLMQTFPSVKLVVDAPLQMQRELTLLRQSAGVVSAGDLEIMLAALGAATTPDYSVNNMTYSTGELRVKSAADMTQYAAKVSDQMKLKGYTFTLEQDFYVVRPVKPDVQ